MALRVGVLGTIEVWTEDGAPVDVGAARQRWVLAALLMDAGRTVPVGTLVERIWGERPPRRSRETLYAYVSRLRSVLAPFGIGLVRESGGYRPVLPADAVDAHRFRALAERARTGGQGQRAVELWEEALVLWRGGEAFAGADTPWFAEQRATLEREQFAARLDLVDIRLALGQHARIVSELSARAEAHPLDERVAGQYILAAYRSGRQAAALEWYERTRRRLADELGVDPGPELRHLHARILAEEAGAPPVGVADRPVPRQLPPAPAAFTGRTRELSALDDLVKAGPASGEAVVISAIGGTGGIGKTWLALRWAHERLDRFPDGQLYVNLRGFDPSALPVRTEMAVRGFLDALGVAPECVPADPGAAGGLYRSLTTGRRMLILLDNAYDTEQVAPLLPGGGTCTVLITSRRLLPGLVTAHGAAPLTLDVLPEEEARALLVRQLGTLAAKADPDSVDALLRHCAGLPLALSIAAARAVAQPELPLAELAEELRQADERLDALDAGDLTSSLRAVFAASHRSLERAEANAFGLLGLATGADISLAAATALLGVTRARARRTLRQLQTLHLIGRSGPDRYQMHDLTRLYAKERGRGEPDTGAALRRLVQFYTDTARAADRITDPHGATQDPSPPSEHGLTFAGPEEAAAWFESEHAGLYGALRLASRQRWERLVWHLAWALDSHLLRRGHVDCHVIVWQTGLSAGLSLNDTRTVAMARRRLGTAYLRTGREEEAYEQFHQALLEFQTLGDGLNEAHTRQSLAGALGHAGHFRRALVHAIDSLRLYRELGDRMWEASALNTAGWFHAHLGDWDQARAYCEEALPLCRALGYRQGEAATLDSLGFIARHTGDHPAALTHYRHALSLRRALYDTYEEADALVRIAELHTLLGDTTAATTAWHQAESLYRDQHRTGDAHRAREELGRLGREEGSRLGREGGG
ncbi:BTAD domain-containing putative transcriptional regulator, partial [Streptomyces sp. NPDC057638]|uniref:AfsR/SARP family transcriptional regulator n=1 Tax=Streptomyces sp. NPDC057638 TaxID=3346190 RepID=UPI0036A9893F